MGNALDLYCTDCGMVTEHRVARTDPRRYHWDDEHEEYFTLLLGRDLDYRLRQRICRHCKTGIQTIEMPLQMMRSLIGELDWLRLLLQGNVHLAGQASTVLGASGLAALIADVFGEERYDPEALAQLSLDQWIELRDTIDGVLSTLSDADQIAIRTYYGLPSSSPGTGTGPSKPLSHILRMLTHPSRGRRLAKLRRLIFP